MCSFILQHMLFKTNNIYLPLMPQRVKLVVYFCIIPILNIKAHLKKKDRSWKYVLHATPNVKTHTQHMRRDLL